MPAERNVLSSALLSARCRRCRCSHTQLPARARGRGADCAVERVAEAARACPFRARPSTTADRAPSCPLLAHCSHTQLDSCQQLRAGRGVDCAAARVAEAACMRDALCTPTLMPAERNGHPCSFLPLLAHCHTQLDNCQQPPSRSARARCHPRCRTRCRRHMHARCSSHAEAGQAQ